MRDERIYTIPLWRSWVSGRGYRRANKAVRYLIKFVSRHMRSMDIKVSPKVNEIIWSRGIRNPPRRIKVKVVLGSDQVVYVLPVDEDVE
ncbi:TPA: 50S ribosomal protein L31e [Candidatus Geothermarchaeota archaeon]|nr:50S ribosomal protein L31e [Candidatus Geothermarchaeota archaeon]